MTWAEVSTSGLKEMVTFSVNSQPLAVTWNEARTVLSHQTWPGQVEFASHRGDRSCWPQGHAAESQLRNPSPSTTMLQLCGVNRALPICCLKIWFMLLKAHWLSHAHLSVPNKWWWVFRILLQIHYSTFHMKLITNSTAAKQKTVN